MSREDYDIGGWATRNDIRCADGRTIRRDAFKDCDGKKVPMVWMHAHNDPSMVLGHCVLENRPEGVYMYGKFNDSEKARDTQLLIEHGDIDGLSIWANQLKQRGGDVLHGDIKEVSVVLAGANPGAFIDSHILSHSDDDSEDEAVITTGEPIDILHSALKDDESIDDVFDSMTEKQRNVVYGLLAEALKAGGTDIDEDEEEEEDYDEDEDEEDEDDEEEEKKGVVKHMAMNDQYESELEEIIDSLTPDEKAAVLAVINDEIEDEDEIAEILSGLSDEQKDAVTELLEEIDAAEEEDDDDDDDDDTDDDDTDDDDDDDDDTDYEDYDGEDAGESEGGDAAMKHNVFDTEDYYEGGYLSHEDMGIIMDDAKRLGSLREAVEQHMEDGVLAHAVYNINDDGTQGAEQTYGMANINYLFPEARAIDNIPPFLKRNDEWVNVVLNGTHHTPFSRVKSVFANITNEEARAKGYIKGNQKATEVFSLLKRTTSPQTIYKLQKMDRDDIIDITDFDVVAWLRGEMRMMLNEEIARAVLIGDGRLPSDDAKIKEDCVRPIATDADLYTIKTTATGGTPEELAKNLIKAAIRARKDYKGSGSPIMFTSESLLTEMMLLEDGLGHPLYVDEAALARRMRVSRIVSCPVLDGFKINGKDCYGIIVNLTDYNIGADKGGEVNMFDDFDIDFNQQKYLIETRISGALIKPYAAIVITAGTTTDGSENIEG